MANISVTPLSKDFGTKILGTESYQSFVISNVSSPKESIFFGGIVSLSPYFIKFSSEPDSSYRTNISYFNMSLFDPIFDSHINCILLQPDGTFLVGGNFDYVTFLVPMARFGKLYSSGMPDYTFPNLLSNGDIFAVCLQPDNSIILSGAFTSIGGSGRNRIARFSSTGTLDLAFNPNVDGTIYTAVIQADGKILIGGSFTHVGGVVRNRIARLNTDGTLDLAFNPNASSTVYSIYYNADTTIYVGGDFVTIGGGARKKAAKLDSTGALDAGFVDPNINSTVRCFAIQSDNKILIGGDFTTIGVENRSRVARLNTDGSIDLTFVDILTNSTVKSIVIQPDNKIIIAGAFSNICGTAMAKLARLEEADGWIDPSFSNLSINNTVNSIILQPDGKLIIVGLFNTIGTASRSCIARIKSNGTLDLDCPDIAIDVKYNPTVVGPSSIILQLSTSAFSFVSQTVNLSVSGTGEEEDLTISLDKNLLEFDKVLLNRPSLPQVITITNNNSTEDALIMSTILPSNIEGRLYGVGVFSSILPSFTVLKTGGTRQIEILLKPTKLQKYERDIALRYIFSSYIYDEDMIIILDEDGLPLIED